MKNKKLREQVKSYIIVTLACVLYALSFDWFYAPNGFTVGGFTGISQIINFFAPILPVGTMVIVLNVPLFIVGLKKFGFAFLCKSIYTMTLSSILIDVIAALHEFAPMDPLLACLYGGVTLGIASGLLFREETTTGGSELGAWIVRSHVERLSIGNICLGIDLTIILIYAAVFHSLNNALYGALALYITTKVLVTVVTTAERWQGHSCHQRRNVRRSCRRCAARHGRDAPEQQGATRAWASAAVLRVRKKKRFRSALY